MISYLFIGDDRATVIDILDVNDSDAVWFEENNVAVSFHKVDDNTFVVYGDMSLYEDGDETPREIKVEVSVDMKCRDALSHLRKECENYLKERDDFN